MTECSTCGTLLATTGCPKCTTSVKPPYPVVVPHPWEHVPALAVKDLLPFLQDIQRDLEPLRNGSYTDGIKQLAFRLKGENDKLRKENAELAAQLKSTKAALKAWEEGRET